MTVRTDALSGTVAVVTGAGRGIGAAIARHVATAGLDVVLVARSQESLEKAARAVRAEGRDALVIPADLTDVSSADQVVEQAVRRFGRIDVLVNNAGGGAPTPFLETTPEHLDHAFHLNVSASFASRGAPPRICSRATTPR